MSAVRNWAVVVVGLCLHNGVSMAAEPVAKMAASSDGELPELVRETWPSPRPMARSNDGDIAGGGPSSFFLSTNNDPDADGPDDVVYTPDGNQILVVHRETDNVTFIDVNTRQVTATVPVGDFPTDIAVTPNGAYAIVPNIFSNDVSIISIGMRAVVGTVPITGQQPYRVAVVPKTDGNLVVVGVINDAINSSFSVINLNIQTEIATFPSTPQGVIGFFFTPESGISGPLLTQFALAGDGETIVCPDRGGSQVVLYNLTSGAAEATLATPIGATSVDVSDDGTVAVIGHDSPGNSITEIDLVAQTVTGTFATPMLSGQVIQITPDKSHAIAALSNEIIFVDLSTGLIDATIMTGIVGDIEISFNGQYAFVSNFNARVIDIASRTLVATVPFAACVESATSPTQLRAVALNSRFREDVNFYSIGAASSVEGLALTGALPEGDAARNLAISPDGGTLVVCHNVSRNVAIDDRATDAIDAYVDVGDRPLAAEITPNGQYAVVCASDANAVRIIDLSTNAIVKSLSISSRPSQVRIAPDSQWAYVLNIAGTDLVSFIQLNGAASAIVSQVPAGQAGAAQGYAYTEISGIELSADGSVVGVCDSFNDLLRLYDTATRTQVAAVPVGDFPMRVAFSPDGGRAYVTNAFGDSVSVVDVDGALSSTIATVPGIEFPLTINVDSSGSFAYAGNSDGNNPQIVVIDAVSNSQVSSVFLTAPARDTHYSAADNVLYAALNDGSLVRINAAGAGSSVIDSTTLSGAPSDLVFSEATKTAFAAQPVPEGFDVVDFEPELTCPADLDGNGTVNVVDLLAVIGNWGPCANPNDCPADIAPVGPPLGDGVVNVNDLLALIGAWGACP